MNSIADAGRDLLRRTKDDKDDKDIKALCEDLCSNKGEAMGTALACAVVSAYKAMDEEGQLMFFKLLTTDYSANPADIIQCSEVYKADPSQKNLDALNDPVEPPRQHLFRRINMSQTGTPTLVSMRSDLQKFS
ncbi:MAG: malonyl-CoA decarboxylase [Pseudohongiellaceae bacterium]|jgi:malonyl-CoA decarboxylase